MEKYSKKILLNSARNCLRYLTRVFGIREISIPYYICPVIWQELRRENVKINFYHINKDFLPAKDFQEDEFILYPNYFGICDRQNALLALKYKNLISDNAHAFFAEPRGFGAFYSPRKFLKVNDGGILFCKEHEELILERDKDRDTDVSKYENFVKNELSLDNQEIKKMSLRTEKYLNDGFFKETKNQRLKFFEEIGGFLDKFNKIEINLCENDVPMVYPFLAEDIDFADKIARELSGRGIRVVEFGAKTDRIFSDFSFKQKILPIPLQREVISCLTKL